MSAIGILLQIASKERITNPPNPAEDRSNSDAQVFFSVLAICNRIKQVGHLNYIDDIREATITPFQEIQYFVDVVILEPRGS
jgi:predicted RNA methylase